MRPLPDIDEPAGHGSGGSHLRAHQVRTPAFSLPALKIPVGG